MELSGLHFSLLGNYPSESRHELCEILFRDGFNGRAWVETKFVALTKIIALSSPHQLLLSSLRSSETSSRYGSAVCDIWIFHEENKSCRRQQALRRRCDVWRKKAVVVNEEKRRKNPRKAHAVRSKKEKLLRRITDTRNLWQRKNEHIFSLIRWENTRKNCLHKKDLGDDLFHSSWHVEVQDFWWHECRKL